MNVISAIKNYFNQAITLVGPGMKVIVLDSETLTILGMVYAMSEIMQQEVYLCEKIESAREVMKHMRCICFLRPTRENIGLLCRELKSPHYGSYYLFFSHPISKQDLKHLAEADEHEVVQEVHEYYADFIPVTPHLFTLNVFSVMSNRSYRQDALNRLTEGLTGLLLSLKKCPMIRYQNSSEGARRLAEQVRSFISREASLFEFRQGEVSPVLLILDRRDDPVTPLLNQWTYQAMVHELLTIHNNRVNLENVPGIKPDMKEITLSIDYDDFYKENMYSNFGEIGQNIKILMEEFQKQSKSQSKLESISDMKAFLENYPAFRKMSGTVSKHVALIWELSRLVNEYALMEVSECEQELACHNDHNIALQKIRALLSNSKVRNLDALRLVLLYALRYETNTRKELASMMDALMKRGCTETEIRLVHQLLDYGGQKHRSGDLFGTNTPISITKRLFKGLKGVDNIYTQHEPLVNSLIDNLLKGKLRETSYPYLGTSQLRDRPADLVVFMIGGVTYEEALAVHMINRNTPGVNVVLGGSTIHNTRSFLDEVSDASGTEVKSPARQSRF